MNALRVHFRSFEYLNGGRSCQNTLLRYCSGTLVHHPAQHFGHIGITQIVPSVTPLTVIMAQGRQSTLGYEFHPIMTLSD